MHICYLREPTGVFHIKNVRTFSLHKDKFYDDTFYMYVC